MNLALVARMLLVRRTLLAHDRWNRARLEDHRREALAAVRAHAVAASPFYRELHKGLADAPLEALPIVTKTMLMGRFDELATDRAIRREAVEAHLATLRGDERYLGRYWVNATSGTTGQPGLFLFDAAEWATTIAAFARANEWAGAGFRLGTRRKIAVVATTAPWAMSARTGATVPSWWTPTLRLDARTPLPELARALEAWAPDTLIGYASIVTALANERMAGRLAISPKTVFSASEVLSPAMRALVEAAWPGALFEAYAVTECGQLAGECRAHRGLHLAEDLTVLEVVDAAGRAVPPGTWGARTLVTSLFNRTQPLIRYEVSDSLMAAPDEPCPCGLPYRRLVAIQGRREDALELPAAAGGHVFFPPASLFGALADVPAGAWQLVREADGLVVRVAAPLEGATQERLAEALGAAIAAQGALAPRITVQSGAMLERNPSGKIPRLVGAGGR